MKANKLIITILTLSIAALAMTGCSDDSSNPVAIDTAPPAVPVGLTATVVDGGVVELAWSENVTDSDFSGFLLQRVTVDGVENLINTPRDITAWVDDVQNAHAWTYRLYAVDVNDNQSAYASATLADDFVERTVEPTTE